MEKLTKTQDKVMTTFIAIEIAILILFGCIILTQNL